MRKSLREDCIERGDTTLLRQWQTGKNEALTPDGVAAGSHKSVWWQCEKGHEWQAAVASRGNGAGCPVCAGKVIVPGENDLETFYPDIAKEWHPTRNGTLTPEAVSPCSNKKVWWRCEKGHSYQMEVAYRVYRNSGCPYCAGRVNSSRAARYAAVQRDQRGGNPPEI